MKISALRDIALTHIAASMTPGLAVSGRIDHEVRAGTIAAKIAAMTTNGEDEPVKAQSLTEISRGFPKTTGRIRQEDALACVNQLMSLEKQLADVKAELACAYGTMRNST